MKRTPIAIPLLLAAQLGSAEGFYFSAGYDFRPGSSDASLGYQAKYVAIEANTFNMGKEEPNTKPGPEYSLNALAFVPSQPIFVKAGVVAGASNKHGHNLGVGYEFMLSGGWAIRGQATHYRVTEDFGDAEESENIISAGLKYQF